MRLENANYRNDMGLVAEDGTKFAVFFRRSDDFPENFSIGLVHEDASGSKLILFRCNGPHGGYNHTFDPDHPHWKPHIHWASEEAIREGHRPEKNAQLTEAYATYEEAVPYFLGVIGVEEAERTRYFPQAGQQSLFREI